MAYRQRDFARLTVLRDPAFFDKWLFIGVSALILIGLLMVASSSIVISERLHHQSFYFLIRQVLALAIGMGAGMVVLLIPMDFWYRYSVVLLLIALSLLTLVLLPHVGVTVNGARRWMGFGAFRLEVSEIAKLCTIAYLASYIVRHQARLNVESMAFLRPLLLVAVISILLLLEPDFGATVIVFSCAMFMLFIAGARLLPFALMIGAGVSMLGLLAWFSPYRMVRLLAFLDPWSRQFDSGYQLTQSLIAFGRGGWFGVGLGESIQKLFYLPEAHTDFLFAVLAEELGLLGCLVVLALFVLVVARGFMIAIRALKADNTFGGYLALGFTLELAFQTVINIGVNVGLLPTKGLTLPLMSYGGSSLLMNCILIALLMRVDYETRVNHDR